MLIRKTGLSVPSTAATLRAIAIAATVAVLVWLLSDDLLLIFAALLIAVILRSISNNTMFFASRCHICSSPSHSMGSRRMNSANSIGLTAQPLRDRATRERYQRNVQEPTKRQQIQARQRAKYRARTAEENKRYRHRSHIGRYGYTTETFTAHLKRIGKCCGICGCFLEGYRNRHSTTIPTEPGRRFAASCAGYATITSATCGLSGMATR